MVGFKWSPQFELGILPMDEEHFQLLARMQQLEMLNQSMTSKAPLLAAMDAFIELARRHFEHEENFQVKIQYPHAGEHQKIHQDLLLKLEKYRQELSHSVYAKIPSSVFDFFQNWLLTHILIVDRRYAEFAARKGLVSPIKPDSK